MITMSDTHTEIFKARIKFRAKAVNPKKDKENPHFNSKYASLDSIITTCGPIMAECGLDFLQDVVHDRDGHIGVWTRLIHESGEWIQFSPVYVKTDTFAQKVGSALTYAKRYSLGMALGIATDEDDDGNIASEPPETKTKRQTQKQATTKSQQRSQTKQTEPAAQAQQQPNKAELMNGIKQAVENIQDHVPTREEIKADLEQKKAKGRQEVHKMACITKKLTKEESRAIIKAETGKDSLTELTLEEIKRMYRLFRDTPAEDLKETAQAHLIAQQEAEITEQEIEALNKEIDGILDGMTQKTA